ncbi:MAG: hypothetical protein ABIO81_13880, partial [Ginsengibacter sp.]
KFNLENYKVVEKALTVNDLLNANEFFLTNSIYHLRWIKTFRDRNYGNSTTKKIYEHIIKTIGE